MNSDDKNSLRIAVEIMGNELTEIKELMDDIEYRISLCKEALNADVEPPELPETPSLGESGDWIVYSGNGNVMIGGFRNEEHIQIPLHSDGSVNLRISLHLIDESEEGEFTIKFGHKKNKEQ